MTSEEKLKRQLAKKYGINLGQVREAVRLQEKFVAHVLTNEVDRKEGYFPSVRLPGLGLFYCPETKKQKLKELNNADI